MLSNDPAEAATSQTDGDREVQRLGRDFVYALYGALRALKLYPLENQTVQSALTDLEHVAGRLIAREGGRLLLRYAGDLCFVNDLRLRIDLGNFASFSGIGQALEKHGIGQVEVDAEVPRTEWVVFLSLLLNEPEGDDPLKGFQERLERSAVRQIRVAPAGETGARPQTEEAWEVAKRTYTYSVGVAREALTGARMGKAVSMRRVKRSVQMIVDQVLNNESSIMGMTALRDYDQYTFAHCVNVCIFSIGLGKKLGLSKVQLAELGIGALLHDIGKLRMPSEVINKAGALDDAEWRMMQEHPTEGLLELAEMRSTSEVSLRALLAAYEHHMKVDLTGYPQSTRPRNPTLFSRIVAVADGFDAATTERSYQATPLLPADVLREMRDNPRRGMDPLLVKAFISMTGIYPVGSVVILDSFELAVVVAPGTERGSMHQPMVRVIYDDMGIPLTPPRPLDLTEVDPATGAPRRTIIKTTDPERYGINVKEYFV